jgi:Ornithine/acetylornithine aminotransferase
MAPDGELVRDLVRRHQSSGRALLYTLAGVDDVEVSAAGAWVTGASGRRYLDCGSVAVFLLGHCHPVVVAAVEAQLHRMTGTSRAFPSVVNAQAARALAAAAPAGLDKVMFLNSGTEAAEAALKLARAVTGRTPVLHLEGSFHGKTLGALSLTDSELLRGPVGPVAPGTGRLPRADPEAAAAVVRKTAPAAVFLEPVQGEAGAVEVSDEMIRVLRAACGEVGALLVCDEIQSGLGRCGDWWAHTRSGVRPDVLLTGKALGGGVIPVSAVVARPGVFMPFDRDPFLHASTFGGNPLACAAVAATLEVIFSEAIPSRVQALSSRLRPALETLVEAWPDLFAGVSGRGLLLGLACRRPDVAGHFYRACLQRGLLVTPCLLAPEVIRFTPPAVLEEEELAFAEAALRAAAEVTAEEQAS